MKKYNLLLPIAGKAQRFLDKGYTMPKPLIMSKDKHIIDWSMDSIDMDECNVIFAVRLEHINNLNLQRRLFYYKTHSFFTIINKLSKYYLCGSSSRFLKVIELSLQYFSQFVEIG